MTEVFISGTAPRFECPAHGHQPLPFESGAGALPN